MSSGSPSDMSEALSGKFSISNSPTVFILCSIQVSGCSVFDVEGRGEGGSDSTSSNVEGEGEME